MAPTSSPLKGRGKDASPRIAKYNQFPSLHRAIVLKQKLDTPPVSKVTTAGDLQKLTIEETQGWTIDPFVEGQEVLMVAHIEPTFAPNYCSPALRLDHVYMLAAHRASRLRVARAHHVRHVRVHFGNNNAEQHTQQLEEAQDRATHGLLAARWSFRSWLALYLRRSN